MQRGHDLRGRHGGIDGISGRPRCEIENSAVDVGVRAAQRTKDALQRDGGAGEPNVAVAGHGETIEPRLRDDNAPGKRRKRRAGRERSGCRERAAVER